MLPFAFTLAFAPQAMAKPFMRTPDVHGDRFVFTSEGDLWLGDAKTWRAERITSDAGNEDNAVFSPDGTRIAFHAEYDGIRGAYVMPTNGGPVKRVTYAMDFRSVTGWTPDGSAVVYRKRGYPTNYEYWTAPVGAGTFKRVPLEFASHVWFGADNDTYCFTRFNRWSMNWFHYIGGLQNQIWVHKDGKFKQITQIDGTNEYPVWCGDRIYFVNEREAKFTVLSVSSDGGKPKTEAGPYPVEVRELSTDGHSVVYEKGPGVEVLDPTTGAAHEVTFDLHSDLIHMRPFQVSAQPAVFNAAITPSGKRVLVETRGQIVNVAVGEGEARLWKAKPGVRFQEPIMSPDAKMVAYISDETGEQQIYVADSDGANAKVLTKGERQIKWMDWSPDAKWLVYYDSRMLLRVLNVETSEDSEVAHYANSWMGTQASFSPDSKYLTYTNTVPHTGVYAAFIYSLADKKSTQVSDGTASDVASAFSFDGKWLVLLSNRILKFEEDYVLKQLDVGRTMIAVIVPLSADTKSPFAVTDPNEDAPKEEKPKEGEKPEFKIDWDGLYDRRIEVPVTPQAYFEVAMVKDRLIMSTNSSTTGVGAGTENMITYYDLGTKKGGTLTPGTIFEFNKDGSKMLVNDERVIDSAASDVPATSGALNFGGLKLTIDPAPEWRQMYWDAWRLLRDYFYVENMHGNDWKAIGAKYAAMLPGVRSREELDELIRWMQCELGSSHEYLAPGDTRSVKPRVLPSYLGVDLEYADKHLRLSHILQGDGFRTSERSPLANPALDVKDGMYLLKVGGVPVASTIEVYDALLGRAGQVVSVTVNIKPTLDGAKTVFLKPVGDESRMRYLEWVTNNRKYVEKASGGRIGYIHIAAMGLNDMSDFVKQYFPQQNKEALIMDDRFNNGGFIQTYVNNILGTKVTGYFNMRNSREPWSRQGDAFLGPVCCLINEFDISCGEEFPHRFKDMGIGPLIGRRTEGGEVGSSPGWPLADGGVVSVPDYGMFTMSKGWVIEGAGVSPDIDVPSDPNAWVQGRDPQIDVAVKTMLDALKKKPVVWPQQPPDRVRVKKSGL